MEVKQRNVKLIEARKKAGLSQMKLGVITGLSVGAIQSYELLVRFPTKYNAEKLASAFGIEVEDLFREFRKPKKIRGVSQKTRDSRLGKAILEKYSNIIVFAKEMRVSLSSISEYINGEVPTQERARAIAEKLGKSVNELFDFWKRAYNEKEPDCLEKPRGLLLAVEDETIPQVEKNDLRSALGNALEKLSEKQRIVIKLRYGLEDGKCYGFEEIGITFGVCENAVRYTEINALQKLRNYYSKNLKDFYFEK